MARKILTLNQFFVKGLERLPRDCYEIASEFSHPDAIMLRSHQLKAVDIAGSVLAIG
jgi:D-3-phosphoglycerate dehydrogenase